MVEKTPALSRREGFMHHLCHVTYLKKNADRLSGPAQHNLNTRTLTERIERHTEHIEAVS
jgi:hypothetical protein